MTLYLYVVPFLRYSASKNGVTVKVEVRVQGRIQKYGLGGREGVGSRPFPSPKFPLSFASPPFPFPLLSPSRPFSSP